MSPKPRLLALSLAISLIVGVSGAGWAQERILLALDSDVPLAEQIEGDAPAQLRALREMAVEHGTVRVIVGLRTPFAAVGALDAASATEQRNDIQAMQLKVLERLPTSSLKAGAVKRFQSIPFMGLSITPEDLDTLSQLPEVISIQEDHPEEPLLNYSVPFIGGDAAWSQGYSGVGQTVAILDTGVEKTHPFLMGKVVSEACYSTTNADLSSESVCPGGVTNSTAPGSGVNCAISGCDHGTHVAGIVGGKGATFSGVAKDASLIAIQVFSKFTSPSACQGTPPCIATWSTDQIFGLERVLALKDTLAIAAVNMSIGGRQYSDQATCDNDNLARKAAIDNLRSVGIATVIASGNEGFTNATSSPGCISSAISVGSTWAREGAPYSNNCDGHNLGIPKLDNISCFSNSAPFLSLLAPGSNIYSSVPINAYQEMSGTSMATPHVAGAWATLKQKQPLAGVNSILNALSSTGTRVWDPRNGVTKPRINVDAALMALSDSPAPLLYSAVLPYARAVQVNTQASAFTNLNNAGNVAGQNCFPSLPANFPATFTYQTTNPSNQLVGTPNTPVDVPPGATQNFVVGIIPTSLLNTEIPLVLKCSNAPSATNYKGVNTFILSAATSTPPDLIAIGATPSNDGVVRLATNTATGLFATAAVNIGSGSTITASADDGGRGLPLNLQVCETDSAGTWLACGNNLTRTVGTNQTVYYTVLVTGQGQPIAFDPANSRLFLRFIANGITVGATNVAVMTQ